MSKSNPFEADDLYGLWFGAEVVSVDAEGTKAINLHLECDGCHCGTNISFDNAAKLRNWLNEVLNEQTS